MAKLPTIDIKGKPYVTVAERVKYFNETYENGCIQTELVSDWDSKLIVIRAIVTPDVDNGSRQFTGYSQAVIGDGMVNKTAALENAETSAVGRALGFMGIGVVESIASVDEVHKAAGSEGKYPEQRPLSDKQVGYLTALKSQIKMLFNQMGYDPEAMRSFIADLISKETIDTIEEAQGIKSELEAEIARQSEFDQTK